MNKNYTQLKIYSQDIGMEFNIEKCDTLMMKSEKRQITEGIGLSNQEKIRTLEEKEIDKYLQILKHNQTSGDEGKKVSQLNEKSSWN